MRRGTGMITQTINSVTGPFEISQLGTTLVHEHLLVGYPGWWFDHKAPVFERRTAMERAVGLLEELKDLGLQTLVDPCPMDLGRDVTFLAEASERSGIRIICTTGVYFEAEGITHTFRHMDEDEIVELYCQEIQSGIGRSGIRAGAV